MSERSKRGMVVDANAAFEFVQKLVASYIDYLNEMGVSPQVQSRTFSTANKEVHYLTETELSENAVVHLERDKAAWVTNREIDALQMPPKVAQRKSQITEAPTATETPPKNRLQTVALPVANPAGSPPAQVRAANQDWDDCRQETDLERRISGCTRLLSGDLSRWSDVDLAEMHHRRGNAFMATGTNSLKSEIYHAAQTNFNLAVENFKSATSYQPNNAELWYKLADAWFQVSNYRDALTGYDNAIGANPNRGEFYNGRANVLMRLREYDRAISDFSRSIQRNTDFASAYAGRGDAYLGKGEHTWALLDYERALRIDPGLTQAQEGKTKVVAARAPALIPKPSLDAPRQVMTSTLKISALPIPEPSFGAPLLPPNIIGPPVTIGAVLPSGVELAFRSGNRAAERGDYEAARRW
jgi:tetratricopeptide (TPR) repeat protein